MKRIIEFISVMLISIIYSEPKQKKAILPKSKLAEKAIYKQQTKKKYDSI